MRRNESKAANIKAPISMTYGELYWLNSSKVATDSFERLVVKDRALFIYPDSYHEPHNDLDGETVFNSLFD